MEKEDARKLKDSNRKQIKDTSEPIGTINIGAFAALSVVSYKAQTKNIDDRIKYLQ